VTKKAAAKKATKKGTAKKAEPNKGGRPARVLSDEELGQVEALASVLPQEDIRHWFGISDGTWHRITVRQPEVLERYKRGKVRAIAKIGNRVMQKALDGELGAACFYLKTQAGWRETNRHELTGKDGEAIETRNVDRIEIAFVDPDDGEDGAA